MDTKTVAEHFKGYFTEPYDGGQDSETGRADFCRLTNNFIIWTQVHGDFKDAAKRATFTPWPHWKALHEACRDSVREHSKDKYEYFRGNITCARIMGDAMKILRARHGLNAPKWWLPLMNQLREEKSK